MNIQKFVILNKYLEWVDQVSEDIEDKTHFTPQEIVFKVCDIIKEESQEWVSVKDNQPTKTGKYWVYRECDKKAHIEKFNGSGWSTNHKIITHWQPLPDAPKALTKKQ